MTNTERAVLCYLRTHRRVWGLTQRELASLMGFESAAHVSRIENGKRAPTVESALACQVLFGIPPSTMFPHAYEEVADKGSNRTSRIQKLHRMLVHMAATEYVEVYQCSKAEVKTCFASVGATTKHEIARAVAAQIPAFTHRMPPVRKPWMSEDPRQ